MTEVLRKDAAFNFSYLSGSHNRLGTPRKVYKIKTNVFNCKVFKIFTWILSATSFSDIYLALKEQHAL